MKYPCLIQPKSCKTDITVRLESEELDNKGKPQKVLEIVSKCNFQDKAGTILTSEKKLVEITGTALFPNDIAPDFPTLSSGFVTVFGETRRIAKGMKARNPDGSVNYCRLEVM